MNNQPICPLPMKINKIPEGKEKIFPSLCSSGEYFAQIKKDGYWYQFERTDMYGYLWSRNISVQTGQLTEKSENVPHIVNILNRLPAGTIIIGEIYYPGKSSKDVTPIMGALPEKAIERQQGEYGLLHYYMHDMIYFKGKNLMGYGASIRYDLLKKVVEDYDLLQEPFMELAVRVDENIQEAVAEALAAGEEGMVLKRKSAPYSPGKRPAWDTIKIKKTATCDAVCMGSCEPTKYYNGKLPIGPNYTIINEYGLTDIEASKQQFNQAKDWPYWIIERYGIPSEQGAPWELLSEKRVPLGEFQVIKGIEYKTVPVTKAYYYGWPTAIRVGAYNDEGKLVEIGTISSGLSEEDQRNLREHPLMFFGKVVELAGMEKHNTSHTLRHFYFKRVRDDKNPEECTIKEIFGA